MKTKMETREKDFFEAYESKLKEKSDSQMAIITQAMEQIWHDAIETQYLWFLDEGLKVKIPATELCKAPKEFLSSIGWRLLPVNCTESILRPTVQKYQELKNKEEKLKAEYL